MSKTLVSLCALVALAGCSTLPDSGPAHRDLEANASASLPGKTPVFDYVLIDINKNILPFVGDPGPGSLYGTFGTGRGPSPEIRVGIGDTVQVTLFEAQSGGLFIPTDAGSRPGNYVTLPNQTVDSKGFITVPYAGRIRALNRTTPAIEQEIINKLKDRAIEPQAVVSVVSQTSTDVTVVGEVNKPSKFAVNPNGEKILDAISDAGGIKDQGYESYVTLQRHGLKGTVYFPNLVTNARENIFVEPGDALYVSFYQRSFMAFGATGGSSTGNFNNANSAQIKFQQDKLTLNEALAKSGGLLDVRSDPAQVFVYRVESRDELNKMNVDLSRFDPKQETIPTIYRANLRDPSGFFAARQFPMRDQDVLYIDNADYVEMTKFLAIISSIGTTTSSVTAPAYTIGHW
jgi:polysaccharide export outer membrane protein